MIPVAWVESAGLGTDATDTCGVLRHTWRVVYRCPGCSTTTIRVLPPQTLDMSGAPGPLLPTEIRDAVAQLVAGHHCRDKAGMTT